MMRASIVAGLVGVSALLARPARLSAQPQTRQVARPASPAAPSVAASAREQLAQKFRDRLAEIARTTDGVVGVSVVDLSTGERFGVNDTLIFPQGSAIKIPLLIELYRQADKGLIKLDDKVAVAKSQQVGGTGVLQWFGDGQSLVSLRDLAVLMIVLSDNSATNVLIEKVGMAAVNGTMRELGLPSIRLQRQMIRPRESAVGN